MRLEFPKDFLWGASTSAHQVEGDDHNDWSEWERSPERIRNLELRIKNKEFWQGFSWSILAGQPSPLEINNYISGHAAEHYTRYAADFDLAQSLGHNAHRFSIEWSRIEPREGWFDEQELAHYVQVVQALRARGLEPFVTLWHWPLPLWLRDKGGWESRGTARHFARYAEKVARALGPDVRFWITVNEPEIYATNSYLRGIWPPQKKNIFGYGRVTLNLIRAHKAAYATIKQINPAAQIGIAKNNIHFDAAGSKFVNRLLKKIADWWWNFWLLNKIHKQSDFIGLNHYFHNRIDYGFNKNENKIVSDLGWELSPGSLAASARELKKYNLPIYVTEHGLADTDDSRRARFILESLKHLHAAIAVGVPIKGYLHWSLIDNFEWDKGFWPRFGLIEVDYKTQERKVRPSAEVYAKICRENSFED
jgi:beta-glucosidase